MIYDSGTGKRRWFLLLYFVFYIRFLNSPTRRLFLLYLFLFWCWLVQKRMARLGGVRDTYTRALATGKGDTIDWGLKTKVAIWTGSSITLEEEKEQKVVFTLRCEHLLWMFDT